MQVIDFYSYFPKNPLLMQLFKSQMALVKCHTSELKSDEGVQAHYQSGDSVRKSSVPLMLL